MSEQHNVSDRRPAHRQAPGCPPGAGRQVRSGTGVSRRGAAPTTPTPFRHRSRPALGPRVRYACPVRTECSRTPSTSGSSQVWGG
ncbi:hypothetical protein HBB16_12270 [Pseudonocardia sp. MCCB 268]|nr:hypothetical protein [Pseudonocardia cytotoxica]